MVFIVTEGEEISSIRYKRCRDGNAKNRSVIAGRIVQIVSICWASTTYRDVKELNIKEINA